MDELSKIILHFACMPYNDASASLLYQLIDEVSVKIKSYQSWFLFGVDINKNFKSLSNILD